MEHVIDDCTCEGKMCTRCQELQCVGNYTKDKRLRSGLKSRCCICAHKDNKQWRQKNMAYDQERKRAWEKSHPEQTLAQRRRRNKYNPPLPRKTPEELLAKQREDNFNAYHKDRQASMERSLKWRKEHPERWCAIQATRRARKTQAGGSYTIQEWEALKLKYDYCCLCCGKREPEIKLHADHVIPVSKGGSSYIDNIQPLCRSCNSSKFNKSIDFRPQNP